ncbi:MAG TPA: biotin/lipoyl-containing protein [Kofleriaceae bacterium]|nr:biotin/lipoyl-containing protein [Kofleriaceae bacterium]
MKKELLVSGAGRDAAISIEPGPDGGWLVVVDGQPRAVDARMLRPGTWSIVLDGQSHLVDLDPRRHGVAASVGLGEVVLTVEDAQLRRLRAATHRGPPPRGEEVRAPIAGKVVKWLCTTGDEVAPGQPLAVLEAMKMENEIVAERGGTVKQLLRAVGNSVETGELLALLV